MKTTSLYLAFCVLALVFTACSKKDNAPELMPDSSFGRANTIAFYFYDDKGVNLVDKNGYKAFSVHWPLESSLDLTRDISVRTDESGRNYLQIFLRGYAHSLNSSFYLTVPSYKEDKVDIKYKLTTEGVVGGPFAADIVYINYNGTKVYSETDGKKWSGKIIVKKGNNKTTVATKF